MAQKKSKSALYSTEMLLALALFAIGGWQLYIAWDNPRHVGYIPSGSLLMTGSTACAWLIWIRRGSQRSTLLPIMLVLSSSILVEHILKWQAKEESPAWTAANGILVTLMLAAMIAEKITHRKLLVLEAACEAKFFEQEDRLLLAREVPTGTHSVERRPMMSEQHLLPLTKRQVHYSFMRPGEFGMSILLIGMTAFRFQSAYSLHLNELQRVSWLGGAVLSLLCMIWYVWLRRRRRHLCDDSGELMIALFTPITFTTICDQLADNNLRRGWLLDLGYFLLLSYFGFRVWKAPQTARELADKYDTCEAKDFTDQGGL